MLSIFVPYRGRKGLYKDFIFHYQTFFPTAHIYILEQVDELPFKRGQLMNVAFNNLQTCGILTEHLLFVDIDIRLKYPIDFEGMLEQHRGVIIPFNSLALYRFEDVGRYKCLNQPSYFLDQPDGGVTLFTKDMFQQCNGFSNLYVGWGREDSDFVRRNKNIKRIPNEMIHLEHARNSEWKSGAFKRNDQNFKKGSDPALDGTAQTTAEFHMEKVGPKVFHCKISGIGVVPNFVYVGRLSKG